MKASAFATRSGVLSRPWRSGFSPSASSICVTSDCRDCKSAGCPLPPTSSTGPRCCSAFLRLATRPPGKLCRSCILEVIVPGLDDTHLFKLSGRQFRIQQIPDQFHKIFSGRGAAGKFFVAVEVLMVEPPDDGLIHDVIKLRKAARLVAPVMLDRDQHRIVVAVTVRVVAFPEDSPILLRREMIGVQPVGGTKPVAPGHVYLKHPPPAKEQSQGHSFIEQ